MGERKLRPIGFRGGLRAAFLVPALLMCSFQREFRSAHAYRHGAPKAKSSASDERPQKLIDMEGSAFAGAFPTGLTVGRRAQGTPGANGGLLNLGGGGTRGLLRSGGGGGTPPPPVEDANLCKIDYVRKETESTKPGICSTWSCSDGTVCEVASLLYTPDPETPPPPPPDYNNPWDGGVGPESFGAAAVTDNPQCTAVLGQASTCEKIRVEAPRPIVAQFFPTTAFAGQTYDLEVVGRNFEPASIVVYSGPKSGIMNPTEIGVGPNGMQIIRIRGVLIPADYPQGRYWVQVRNPSGVVSAKNPSATVWIKR